VKRTTLELRFAAMQLTPVDPKSGHLFA